MWIELFLLGIVIGFNNFATALTLGTLGQRAMQARILTVFAVFEFGIPLVGLWLGRQASQSLTDRAEILGPALLAVLGLVTLFEATRDSRSQLLLADALTSWKGLILLAAALSVDNLVVGFSLGLTGVSPLVMATTIMIFSVAFAWIGLQIGGRGRRRYETLSEVVSGLLLIGLAYAGWSGLF